MQSTLTVSQATEDPMVKVTFVDGVQPQVEFRHWEKINARLMERANRAISRERNRLRAQALREARKDE